MYIYVRNKRERKNQEKEAKRKKINCFRRNFRLFIFIAFALFGKSFPRDGPWFGGEMKCVVLYLLLLLLFLLYHLHPHKQDIFLFLKPQNNAKVQNEVSLSPSTGRRPSSVLRLMDTNECVTLGNNDYYMM